MSSDGRLKLQHAYRVHTKLADCKKTSDGVGGTAVVIARRNRNRRWIMIETLVTATRCFRHLCAKSGPHFTEPDFSYIPQIYRPGLCNR